MSSWIDTVKCQCLSQWRSRRGDGCCSYLSSSYFSLLPWRVRKSSGRVRAMATMPLPPEENGAGTKKRTTQRAHANTPAKPPARYLPFAQSLAQSLSTPSFRGNFSVLIPCASACNNALSFTEVYTADSMPQILFKWRSYSLNSMKI